MSLDFQGFVFLLYISFFDFHIIFSNASPISFDNSDIKLLLLSIISIRFTFLRHKAVFIRNKFGNSCNVDNVNDVGNIDDNNDTNEVNIDVDVVDVVDVID